MPDMSLSSLGRFDASLAQLGAAELIAQLQGGLIGEGRLIATPFGDKPLVYADYTASGRALRQVEAFVFDEVLPFYANAHTEASYCGALMTGLRREARARIAALTGADDRYAVIFNGAGATAGINRAVALWQVGPQDLVVLGPYEHHSNILPWRESGAVIVTLPEAPDGGPSAQALAKTLASAQAKQARRVICAFSAASNVTGDIADVAGLTRQAKASGALILWDYAGGGPYLPIAMTCGDAIDAVVVSPHKFIGGPAASGLLIIKRASSLRDTPLTSGGGTVRFVSGQGHDYSSRLETREEAGTPDVVGDIRAALAFIVKDHLMRAGMPHKLQALARRAEAVWGADPRIDLLGGRGRNRLPILAFRLRDHHGGFHHQQLVTRLLSDRFGIQARGGCACAGPYVHELLGIDPAQSAQLRHAILNGDEAQKPGFVRLNLSCLMSEATVEHILHSVLALADSAAADAARYRMDRATAIFAPISDVALSA